MITRRFSHPFSAWPARAAVVFALAMTGCGHEPHETAEPPAPVSVTVAAVAPARDAAGNLVLSGQVMSAKRAELSTRVMGTIVSLNVEEGQAVRAGQVLGSVRSTDIKATSSRVDANIAEVEAVVANAKRDLDRFEALYAKGSATQKELDDVRTGYARALAQLEAAKQAKNEVTTQLGYATITAPFAGYVTHKFMQQGALASPGMPIVTVEGGGFKLVARVSEQDLPLLKTGQSASVHVDALNQTFEAKIARINPSTTFTGAQYEVTLTARNYPKDLAAGMFLRVTVAAKGTGITDRSASVWVPDSILVRRGGLTGIYVVSQGGEALLRWVRLGAEENGRVEVRSGLSEGDQYIVQANGKLEDGHPVTIANSSAQTN